MSAFRLLETIGLFAVGKTGGKKRRARATRAGSRSVGRYLLHERIGRGAVGEVWRADDPRIGRSVAVKLLNIPAGAARGERAEWEKRFVREARAAGALSHPGIVTIHDVGVTEDGSPYIVMELVEGSSLDKILPDGPVDERIALVWGAQIAEALEAAHRAGVVHRDIKPANVLIDTEGRARIADFGIARLSESDLTHEALFLGSPAFASPEQIRGAAVDGRSDLFSLGGVLYALLTGARPFDGADLSSLAYAIAHVEPAPMRRLAPDVSPQSEAVVMKALEKEPDGRYRAAQEMAEDLRSIIAGRPPKRAAVPSNLDATPRSDAPAGGTRREGAGMPASARPGWSTGAALVVSLVMALGLAAAVGLFLSRRAAAPSAAPIASRHAPPDAAPLDPGPATPAGSGSLEAEAWGESRATAEINVRVAHSLSDGVVTIWSGKRRLLHSNLRSQQSDSWLLRLPPGPHPIRIRVESAERGLDLEEGLSRTVRESQRVSLYVRVKERPNPKLDILWTDN